MYLSPWALHGDAAAFPWRAHGELLDGSMFPLVPPGPAERADLLERVFERAELQLEEEVIESLRSR